MNVHAMNGSAVVARFTDGRVLKGTTQDFAPGKPVFHLHGTDDGHARGIAVPIGALKAVFFVKTYEGNPEHVEDLDVAEASGQGRRIVVTFTDGEIIAGFTTGYAKQKPGFFVIPADPESNNARIFVVNASVRSIAWADAATRTMSA